MRLHAAILLALAGTFALTTSARAGDAEILLRLERLQEMLEAQQRQIEEQNAEIAALKARLAERNVVAIPAPVAPVAVVAPVPVQLASATPAAPAGEPSLTFKDLRPTISSPDGDYTLALRTMLQLDMAEHFQDDSGSLASDFRRGSVGGLPNRENTAARDLSDGGNFRRARIGIEGKLAGDFGYRIVYDFGGSGTEGPARLNEGAISYSGFDPFVFTIGAFSPPANLDDSTGATDTLFLERATPAELSRTLAAADARYGFGAKATGDGWFASLHATGGVASDAETFDEQKGIVGRAAFALARGEDYNVQIGANGSWVVDPADQGAGASPQFPVRFRDRPELRVDGARLIDTGGIDADSAYAAGVEFGANWGPFFLQAENFWYGMDRRGTGLDPEFSGWYAEAAYTLTGEARRYIAENAAWGAPRPKSPLTQDGGSGAWEVALRYSETDLNFNEGVPGLAPPSGGVRGGEQRIWTLGLNWYINANLRLAANYLWVDVDRLNPASAANPTPFGPTPNTPPIGAEIGQDYEAIGLRTQFAF